jgi:hypothetical protein
MFRIKPTTTTTIISKPFKLDNVLINVIFVIITHNQIPKQHVFKACEPMKAKTTTD